MSKTSFETAQVKFCDWLRMRNCSPATLRITQTCLKSFGTFLKEEGRTDLRNVTCDDFCRYREKILGRHSPNGRYTVLSRLRVFFKFLEREQMILFNPTANLVLKMPSVKLPPVLTPKETVALIESPCVGKFMGLRDRAILELLYSTGLRAGELAGLDVGDVDLNNRLVFVRNGKGAKDRVVPVGRTACFWINTYVERLRGDPVAKPGNAALFLTVKGGRLAANDLPRKFQRYGRKAGLTKRIYPHLLRHSMAGHLLERGASSRVIQKMLGHTDLASTQIYTRLEAGALRKVLRKYHPRGGTFSLPPHPPLTEGQGHLLPQGAKETRKYGHQLAD